MSIIIWTLSDIAINKSDMMGVFLRLGVGLGMIMIVIIYIMTYGVYPTRFLSADRKTQEVW